MTSSFLADYASILTLFARPPGVDRETKRQYIVVADQISRSTDEMSEVATDAYPVPFHDSPARTDGDDDGRLHTLIGWPQMIMVAADYVTSGVERVMQCCLSQARVRRIGIVTDNIRVFIDFEMFVYDDPSIGTQFEMIGV